jgi:hypothetical protein
VTPPLLVRIPASPLNEIIVSVVNSDGTALIDSDFDIFGGCPSSWGARTRMIA